MSKKKMTYMYSIRWNQIKSDRPCTSQFFSRSTHPTFIFGPAFILSMEYWRKPPLKTTFKRLHITETILSVLFTDLISLCTWNWKENFKYPSIVQLVFHSLRFVHFKFRVTKHLWFFWRMTDTQPAGTMKWISASSHRLRVLLVFLGSRQLRFLLGQPQTKPRVCKKTLICSKLTWHSIIV